MINKYGKLKALILINLHKNYLVDIISNYLLNIKNHFDVEIQINYAYKMYEYINKNMDLIYNLHTFNSVCKLKLKEFNRLRDNKFIKFSYSLNYVCKYIKRDGSLCTKDTCNGFDICKQHLRCQFNREIRIQNSLKGTGLFNNLTDIIIQYDFR
jgi:hypothetical protein